MQYKFQNASDGNVVASKFFDGFIPSLAADAKPLAAHYGPSLYIQNNLTTDAERRKSYHGGFPPDPARHHDVLHCVGSDPGMNVRKVQSRQAGRCCVSWQLRKTQSAALPGSRCLLDPESRDAGNAAGLCQW